MRFRGDSRSVPFGGAAGRLARWGVVFAAAFGAASCSSSKPATGGAEPVAALSTHAPADDADRALQDAMDASARGDFSRAADRAGLAAGQFQARGDAARQAQALSVRGSALHALGHYDEAVFAFHAAEQIADRQHDFRRAAALHNAIGAIYTEQRRFDLAERTLNEALEREKPLNDPRLRASILVNRGNLHSDMAGVVERRLNTAEADPDRDPAIAAKAEDAAQADYAEAVAAADGAGDGPLAAKASADAAVAADRAGRSEPARTLNADAIRRTLSLPDSHEKAFLLLTEGRTAQSLAVARPPDPATPAGPPDSKQLEQARRCFDEGMKVATRIDDVLCQSYAAGYAGNLDEIAGRTDDALASSRRAAFLAQKIGARDALARWQWQIGRLLRRDPARLDNAIASYAMALQTFQAVRSDAALGNGNGDPRLSFRDENGPLYFQMADLLLRRAALPNRSPAQQRADLISARDVVERFKSGELEDYFRDPCTNQIGQERDIDNVGAGTAVVYLIPLEDRTELLVSYPLPPGAPAGVKGLGLREYSVPIPRTQLEDEVDTFRERLENRITYDFFEPARKLYDQLIRPIEPDLRSNQIDTLVFVPDGKLRTIPMEALNDGRQFLVEKYAVAVSPGLQLMEPRRLDRKNIRMLANGLSVSVGGFSALPAVPGELANIKSQFGGTELLNQQFVIPRVRTAIEEEPYSIVHIASHGVFSSNADDTFLLSYDYDKAHNHKLGLNQLQTLISQGQFKGRPVELLTLSACQTAAGDDRAALGLAGVAIKAGARSAVASLWFVNDEVSTELVTEFYRQLRLHPSMSKAQALRQAQIMILHDPKYREYRHPIFWAPYLVIGNWL